MRVATWNINSLKARLDRLLAWLETAEPDVVCLQELKCADADVPIEAISAAGYDTASWGLGRWNGVAILSKVGIADVRRGISGQPAFGDETEPRAITATCGPVRVQSLYIPNGRDVADPHFPYKLAFLKALAADAAADAAGDLPFAAMGDFNICPTDDDVWDVDEWPGTTHVTKDERDALAAVQAAGLADVFPRPLKHAHPFTFWDYRNLDFPKNRGLRIDLALANPAFKAAVTDAYVDRNERKGKGASDHAPLVVDLDL
ncbi:exodeoxyribonuclease III [Glycomyces algeriensis]|uniref:Exodeoxyribonuclease III n=1 Tax=Glycomyces algeriensis TaxID=256037 RepID=A0A9W6G9C4_9ACTN|nr:exodeoxyribonuclease III [Glycomyces algeriensis]MDA1367331.1 exodeoxyribonuclease III [Glycomyces algeriensis]MDR7351016.1 exodeoxyribonuclease-3 [Glycomyces algeriensis]GLI43729.1 exodeoxyribonuclease III [Glycomyces algeriensis]